MGQHSMTDRSSESKRGFGRGRGGRGRGRGGAPKPAQKDGSGAWVPVTKLGRLVKDRHITSLEQIYRYALPIKESQIIDYFLPSLKDEVVKITPVQKQTTAGQRTRFKAFVVVADVATAIRGAIIVAKLSVVPIRKGYWGNKIGAPHTIPSKVTGKCGSVSVRLVPAPRGTGVVAARAPKKLLQFAGIQDCYSSSCGHTKTLGNFVKATFQAISRTFGYLTPDFWTDLPLGETPYQEFSEVLSQTKKR